MGKRLSFVITGIVLATLFPCFVLADLDDDWKACQEKMYKVNTTKNNLEAAKTAMDADLTIQDQLIVNATRDLTAFTQDFKPMYTACADTISPGACANTIKKRPGACVEDFNFGRFDCCNTCVKYHGGDPTKADDPYFKAIARPKSCTDEPNSNDYCHAAKKNNKCARPDALRKCIGSCGYCGKP